MLKHRFSSALLVILTAVFAFSLFSTVGYTQQNEGINPKQRTVLVTVHADSNRMRAIADKLQPEDFIVREDNQQQQIISVKRPAETPIILAVLIQDDLTSHVGNEIKGLKEFIRNLPDGSSVMIGYITAGSLRVTQEFTENRTRAAESIRIPISSSAASAYSPYVELLDALRRFEGKSSDRCMVLLISDGLDLSQGFRGGSPMFSMHLERSIKEAQRRGIAVYSFYAPSVGLTGMSRLASSYGQGSLNRLANETGGDAFFSGIDFVAFDAYFKEMNELIGNQWLITYFVDNSNKGFRRIEVTTDFDLNLNYQAGYYPK